MEKIVTRVAVNKREYCPVRGEMVSLFFDLKSGEVVGIGCRDICFSGKVLQDSMMSPDFNVCAKKSDLFERGDFSCALVDLNLSEIVSRQSRSR